MRSFLGLMPVLSMPLLALSAGAALAQDAAASYPDRPIKSSSACRPAAASTPSRASSPTDCAKFGQPVVVEDRGGAAGNIGAEAVFNAAPDGYTLLAAQPAPLTINPLLYKHMNFDPTKFAPVAIMTSVANVLLVRPDFPAKTAQEFIAYAKANPGKINYASQGIGTTSHLTAALFERMTGTKLVHVPYKGTAPALNDLIAGHVDMIFMELASAIKLHQAGQRAHPGGGDLAARIPELPDIPTLDEAGVTGFESGTWNAIAAPPKTPAAIVAKLNAAIDDVLARARRCRPSSPRSGCTPSAARRPSRRPSSSEETTVWGDVIKEAHITTH